ncbi:MAG: flagellar hook-basal body complex protein FliE [Candidatus Zixiibacteriota bacterium]|jgi:flagellar hook-basal body complex protein FliE
MSAPVNQITRLIPSFQGQLPAGAEKADGAHFTELLEQMIGSVNNFQNEAAQAQQLAATGEAADLHQVMIAVEEAGITMDLLLEIRNRLVDAYQSLIQMPI